MQPEIAAGAGRPTWWIRRRDRKPTQLQGERRLMQINKTTDNSPSLANFDFIEIQDRFKPNKSLFGYWYVID